VDSTDPRLGIGLPSFLSRVVGHDGLDHPWPQTSCLRFPVEESGSGRGQVEDLHDLCAEAPLELPAPGMSAAELIGRVRSCSWKHTFLATAELAALVARNGPDSEVVRARTITNWTISGACRLV
jgi:hypothetical protein